jgi:hypothetical protein
LDVLAPDVIANLISSEIAAIIDRKAWAKAERKEAKPSVSWWPWPTPGTTSDGEPPSYDPRLPRRCCRVRFRWRAEIVLLASSFSASTASVG